MHVIHALLLCLAMVDLTHILQGYFTGTKAIIQTTPIHVGVTKAAFDNFYVPEFFFQFDPSNHCRICHASCGLTCQIWTWFSIWMCVLPTLNNWESNRTEEILEILYMTRWSLYWNGARGLFHYDKTSYGKVSCSLECITLIGSSNHCITLKFDRHLSSNSTEAPVKFHSHRTIQSITLTES